MILEKPEQNSTSMDTSRCSQCADCDHHPGVLPRGQVVLFLETVFTTEGWHMIHDQWLMVDGCWCGDTSWTRDPSNPV